MQVKLPKQVSFISRLSDLLAPRACTCCGNRLTISEEVLCGTCLLQLPRTNFQFHPADNIMAQRFFALRQTERAAAWFYYLPSAPESRLIHQLKYYHQPQLGLYAGRMMAKELKPSGFFADMDAIVPIPLTKKRQRQRGYNQSALLAKALAQELEIPVMEVLERTRFEESQTHKTTTERHRNVAGVFSLKASQPIAGLHLLLVDDIVTTGATMLSAAEALLQGGVAHVSFLSIGFTHG